MASDSNTSVTELMHRARSVMAANPVLAPQMEQFWKVQDEILKETENFSKAWFKRRHEAAQSALEAVRDANGNGTDPSSAFRVMMDWQQHSFQRLTDDMQEWVELCSRCAGRITSAEVQAGKQGVEEVTKRAKSTSKTKHSMPV